MQGPMRNYAKSLGGATDGGAWRMQIAKFVDNATMKDTKEFRRRRS